MLFAFKEKGQGLVEYAILVALIVIALAAVLSIPGVKEFFAEFFDIFSGQLFCFGGSFDPVTGQCT